MLLYFVPKAKAVTPELLREHGFDRLLSQTRAHNECSSGPDGAGIIITDGDKNRIVYDKTRQTWSRRFGKTSWVGHWNDTPATPEQLARKEQITGSSVTLVDGNVWMIPLLRQWRDGEQLQYVNALPRITQQSPDTGQFLLTDVVPQYRELWERSLPMAESIFEQLTSGTEASIDDDQVYQYACDLLATNYRVDVSVISHLQLLTTTSIGEIIRHALDIETLRASLKNRLSRHLSGGTNSSTGDAPKTLDDSTPTTQP